MPEFRKHSHSSHDHGHGHRYKHGHINAANTPLEHVWEWFWSCCNCGEHDAMSTTMIVACPGCVHIRCEYCPVDAVKVYADRIVAHHTSPERAHGTSSRVNATSSKASSAILEAVHCDFPSLAPVPAQIENFNVPEDLLSSFDTLTIASSTISDPSVSSGYSSGIFSYPPTIADSFTDLDDGDTDATATERGSSIHSSCSSDNLSESAALAESATDFDSENTESDGSTSDTGGMNEVVHLLDCRLLAILDGELDLAASLIPKIHDLINGEDELPLVVHSGSHHRDGINALGDKGSKGKLRASGDSSSAPENQNVPSGSSSQKNGRGLVETERREEQGTSKRPRREPEGNSGNSPDGGPPGDQARNPGGNSGRRPKDDTVGRPSGDSGKGREDPSGDPGGNPSFTGTPEMLPNFACPFHKLDPLKYGIWTHTKYEKCPGSRIKQLRRIKYHLKEAHMLPPLPPHCLRCFCSFKTEAMLQDHCLAPVACSPFRGPPSCNDGIDEGQWKRIEDVFGKNGQKHIDDVSRWYEIWRILFPGVREPSTSRVERPGYISRSKYSVGELSSKFERRIEEDIKNEVIQPDPQIQRYLYHFRQTLEISSAAYGLHHLEDSDKNERERGEVDTPNSRAVNTSRQSAGRCIDETNIQPCVQHFETGWFEGCNSQRTQSEEGFQTKIQNSGSRHSPECLNLNTQTRELEFLGHTQAPFNLLMSDSTFTRQNELSSDVNKFSNDTHLNQFYNYDFDSEAASVLESLSLPHLKVPRGEILLGSDLPTDPCELGYLMSDDLVADLL